MEVDGLDHDLNYLSDDLSNVLTHDAQNGCLLVYLFRLMYIGKQNEPQPRRSARTTVSSTYYYIQCCETKVEMASVDFRFFAETFGRFRFTK